jgi:sugar-specific transcriptional regulator TrmB
MRELLKKLGFSGKETDVYLAALKMGNGSISSLAKLAKIKRPTVYVILERLHKMGLMVLGKKDGKQIFTAENPNHLLTLIEEKKERSSEKEKKIRKALPAFKAIAKKETKAPLVKYYEGTEGVWNIFTDIADSRDNSLVVAAGRIYDVLGHDRFSKEIVKKRGELRTMAKIIADQHPDNLKGLAEKKTNIREYRFLPPDVRINTSVYIYADKAAFIFYKEFFSGLIIDNKELSQVMRFLFNSLWKELEGKNIPKEQ